MKKFSNYQYVGGEMNERDKKEVGSKFWNKGKWDNFVLPFLPDDCSEMTLIDVGCNAGIFLKLAEDKGFETVIGVDSDEESILKARKYREENNGSWDIMEKDIKEYIDFTPVVDYTVLAMTHYYFSVEDWHEYLEKLKLKSRYCIIVTADKKPNEKIASSDTEGIMRDMKDWKLVGEIPMLPLEGDPCPRKQWSFCFKNPDLERVAIDSLDNGNGQQRNFLEELDKGIHPLKTNYFRRLKDYRSRTTSRQQVWTSDKVEKYIIGQEAIYKDVKERGIMNAIEVDEKGRIKDGNHRHSIVKHLGNKSIIVRRVIKGVKKKGAIIYVSSNKENPEFEDRVVKNILANKGDLPVFSVTQKPMDFGTNICVGEDIGVSGFNVCRQLQKAIEAAKVDYVISCESDCLYPPDYFTFVPPKLDSVYRNTNNYILPYKKDYFNSKDSTIAFQIAGRDFLLARLNYLFKDQPEWSAEMKNFPKEINEKFLNGWDEFKTENPCISVKTGDGMRKHTNSGKEKLSELPYWGTAKEVRNNFKI